MVDERTLVADIKSYIDNIEGFKAEVEEHPINLKRMDLTVYYDRQILFNAEFKRPTTIEGKTPRNADVVQDAFNKANNLRTPSKFFVTSNFNETIVWDNRDNTLPVMGRDIRTINLEKKVSRDEDFRNEEVRNAISVAVKDLCTYILDIYHGKIKTQYKPLGDSFIEGLNSNLSYASEVIKEFISDKVLNTWWKSQGYPPKYFKTSETELFENEKELMARYSLYVFANKIVFYYVLKRSYPEIPEIDIPKEDNIGDFQVKISRNFDNAKKISGDFETVFENSDADKILFQNDKEVQPVRSIIVFLKSYDFAKLNQDVLGNIYDRLINPEERHRNGQYYTPIPVVDFINALTIKDKDARVMDPACGSGTFLTRAFDYKLQLYGDDSRDIRKKLITQIFGDDIAVFPAHLATIALASKIITDSPDVYPNIIRKDFLDLKTVNVIPKFRGLDPSEGVNESVDLNGSSKQVSFTPIDAFVSNLPYIRQETISNIKNAEQKKIENFLKENGFPGEIDKPSSTSDFYVYFFYYILPFLREGSRVGFLTSDTWLNVDYGTDLKIFLNKYFKIVAIIDSSVERWFEDAEVNTIIIVLERCSDKNERENNKIKFVRINKKMSEIVKNINDALKIAKALENGKSNDGIEITREVAQGSINLNDIMRSKFYPYLRGPDVFFKLVDNKNMVPLDELMDVRFGIKTGANEFFYVKDVTEEYKDSEKLNQTFGLRPGELKKLRIVRSGDKSDHVIEKEYLEPIIKGPKEFTKEGKLLFNEETRNFVFIVRETDKNRIKKYAKEYLNYGEKNPASEPYSERETCKNRNPWWKLSPDEIPEIAFTMYFSSQFMYPKVSARLDHTLYLGTMKKEYSGDILSCYSFLNSSLSYLYPDLYGRNYGGGAVGFMVYETQKLPFPKPEVLRPYYDKLKEIMEKLEARKIGSVFEEIWDGNGEFELSKVKQDRLELDRLILNALGFEKPDQFLKQWYISVVITVKQRLDRAKSLKTIKKGGKISLVKVANDIIKEINVKKFPYDYILNFTKKISVENGNKISMGNDLNGLFVEVDKKRYYFDDQIEQKYVYYCALNGVFSIDMADSSDMKRAVSQYEEDVKKWKKQIDNEIESLTDDDDHRKKLHKLVSKNLGWDY
ncbi:MAG: N-6 DNA methylase [Thermoplasmatales archaeon]